MAIHDRVLEAALSLCRGRGGWTFRAAEVAAAVPDLNLASVRTHVMSRCCVNAPAHHSHRWPYFRRVRRGVYEILPASRQKPARRVDAQPTAVTAGMWVEVRESGARYAARVPGLPETLHASTLDDLTEQLRRIPRDSAEIGTGPSRLLRIRIEVERERADPVLEAFEKDIDRTLVRRALRMSPEERLRALERWANSTEKLRGAAQRSKRERGE